jgi:long-chain acyl-CoA synthetase
MNDAGIQFGHEFSSRDEVLERAARASTGLAGLGVARDDTVALMLRNDPVFIEATMAVRTIGAIPVPINWHLQGEEIDYILKDANAKVLIVHSDLYHGMLGYVPEGVHVLEVETPPLLIVTYNLNPAHCSTHPGSTTYNLWMPKHEPWTEEPETFTSSMLYTSGTTGRPKGVRRQGATPEQHEAQLEAASDLFGIGPGVRTIIPAPIYHSAPNSFSNIAFQLDTFMVIMPRFDAVGMLKLIEEFKISCIQMVPTMFVRMLKLPEEIRNQYDLSSLEYIIHAAAPCPPQVKDAMIKWWGPIIWEYYGSTEMGAVVKCSSEAAQKYPGTVGKATDYATVKILDDDRNELPAEIESVLIEMEGVHDCAVFGIPDDDFGESVAAIVEPEENVELTPEAVTAFLVEHIAKFKLPKHIEFRKDLPREDSGKLFKRKLKEPFWDKTGRKI